jgi:hypothetical protein
MVTGASDALPPASVRSQSSEVHQMHERPHFRTHLSARSNPLGQSKTKNARGDAGA